MSRLVLIGFLLSSFASHSQESEFIPSYHSFGKGDLLPFNILYPSTFSKEEKYPLVLFLHGAGERGNDNKKQLAHGSKLFLDAENRKEFPAIVIFPQCPEDDFWSNVKKFRDENDRRQFEFKVAGKPTKALNGAMSLMDSLVRLPFIDVNRLYVAGLSMGGMGTFEIVSRRPDLFAAAMPICGGGNPKSVKRYAEKVPFWVFHGAKDDVVRPQYSETMVEALKDRGGDVTFTLYPEANHNSWDPAFAEPGFLSWMFSKTKTE